MNTNKLWGLCLLLYVSLIEAVPLKETQHNTGKPMAKNSYILPQNCNFMVTDNNSEGRSECSPKLDDGIRSKFEGILINGPSTVVWPKDVSENDNIPGPFGETSGPLRLMICGLNNLKYSFMGLNGSFSDSVLIVAVNQETGKTYSGKMENPEFLPDFDDENFGEPKVSRPVSEAKKNLLIPNYFNLDLVHNLGVPINNSTLSVYAILGEFKSNTLTIVTKVE